MALINLILALAIVQSVFSLDLLVNTSTGQILGFYKNSSFGTARVFLGVPYAVPPVGAQRFRPTEIIGKWNGILNASTYKPTCMQATVYPMGMSEDCLTLNVYTPTSENQNSKFPVMFWVHGGSFTSGSGALFDPSALVARGVMAVTINYRLGAFGYLQTPWIQSENPNFPTLGGMIGIYDQIVALKWISMNAVNFGGDPDNITIFGESAGALSLNYLISSPLTEKGLFKNVIIESGSSLGPWGPKLIGQGLDIGSQFIQAVNARSLNDLRAIPADQFLKLPIYSSVTPSLDEYIYPLAPQILLENNLKIPTDGHVIVGSNSLDSLFTSPFYSGPFPETPDQYIALVKNFFGNGTDEILQIYPASGSISPRVTFQKMNADLCVICPTRKLAKLLQTKMYQLFLYQFGFNPIEGEYRNLSSHFGEVPLVLGYPFQGFPFDATLSEKMTGYWASFAISGIPNSNTTGVFWPDWNSSNQHINFNNPISVIPGFHDTECNFWDMFTNVSTANLFNSYNYCYQAKAL